ncbi:C-type lectin-like [Trinorchestia longiramus]|nr:C-type lectin-like [Trinorchestia longiramus]
MASLQFALLLVLGVVSQSLAADQSVCTVQVAVTYTDGSDPSVDCYDTCGVFGIGNDLWFEGLAYQRVPRLTTEFGLMVKLNYQNGALTGCSTVPYQTVEETAAEIKEMKACMGIDEENSSSPQPSTTASASPVCPEGFTELLGNCYLVSAEPLTRSGALAFCQQNDATLAFIESQEEQEAVQTILTTHTYIGINDIKNEGIFTSMTGEPAQFTNWNDGEPNGEGVENCIVMRANKGFRWNDVSCSKAFVYVCQIVFHYCNKNTYFTRIDLNCMPVMRQKHMLHTHRFK